MTQEEIKQHQAQLEKEEQYAKDYKKYLKAKKAWVAALDQDGTTNPPTPPPPPPDNG